MKRLSIVVSLPGENNYLREQEAVARTTAQRLGLDLQVINAKSDPITQSQQVLELVQAHSGRPDAVIVEPVNNQGLPRVAEAAVAAGIGWVISNARVDYLEPLRKNAKAPVFAVSQDHTEIGRMQGGSFWPSFPVAVPCCICVARQQIFWRRSGLKGWRACWASVVQMKSLKIQWTAESAYNSVRSWLRLSTVHAADTHLIAAQNTDFVLAARQAFEENASGPDRQKWLTLPYCGVGVLGQAKALAGCRHSECRHHHLAHHRYRDGYAGPPHSKRLATSGANFCEGLVTAHSGRPGQDLRLACELSPGANKASPAILHPTL
jgi:hypothetical protein